MSGSETAVAVGAIALVIGTGILAAIRKPWVWLSSFIRRGRGTTHSRLKIMVDTQIPPMWTFVWSSGVPHVAWQCRLIVTNDGNRMNSPAKGELKWRGRSVPFAASLPHRSGGALPPEDTDRLTVAAWTPELPGESISGAQRCRLTVIDRYGHSSRLKVDFDPSPGIITDCPDATMKNGWLQPCDLPKGHTEAHMSRRRELGYDVVTTWPLEAPPQRSEP